MGREDNGTIIIVFSIAKDEEEKMTTPSLSFFL
jgi:hypothetical protein